MKPEALRESGIDGALPSESGFETTTTTTAIFLCVLRSVPVSYTRRINIFDTMNEPTNERTCIYIYVRGQLSLQPDRNSQKGDFRIVKSVWMQDKASLFGPAPTGGQQKCSISVISISIFFCSYARELFERSSAFVRPTISSWDDSPSSIPSSKGNSDVIRERDLSKFPGLHRVTPKQHIRDCISHRRGPFRSGREAGQVSSSPSRDIE